ncbi:MAG: hypothetical protein Q9213_003712 [Squamulea squamosa]
MTPLPSISRRKHYRTVPGEPSEPTSTIVLTSPRGYYVDIRVCNKQQAHLSSDPKTFNGQLQWAFAGTKETLQIGGRTISTWHHPIDSLSDDPKPDKGEMIELEDGDTLEKGETVDEETGEVVRYEELWEELPLDSMKKEAGPVCIVLKIDEAHGVEGSGMVIRIGGYCEGIFKDSQGITIERWEWVEGEGGGKWERTVSYLLTPRMANIKFIPPQMGPVSNYSVRAMRSGPLSLLLKDAGILLTVLPYLPFLFLPLNTKVKEKKEKSTSKLKSTRDNAIQALLCLLQTIILILFIPALISLPGILFFAAALLCVLILRLIAWPTQGPRILYSVDPPSTSSALNPHPGERWVFINGICTGSSGLQANIDRLSHLFGRQVLGIHNQSYGMISDLVECLLQRCLSYKTLDVRVACEVVKDLLVDDEVKRVVLVAHSQGGIIASMVVDELFMELSGNMMGKMEIYTFGSAASHFHNPPTSSANTASSTFSTQPTTIPYIEHYANEYDMVPRWGVLYATSSLLNNRYAGNVFVREGASGHMFVEHYLDPIFPMAQHHSPKAVTKVKKGHPNGNGDANGQTVTNGNGHLVEEALSYLDAIVDVDDTIPLKRRNSAPLKPLTQNKHRKNAENAQSHHTLVLATGNGMVNDHGVVDGFEAIGGDVLMEQAARGKTVKELSRLWLYLGGSSPEERKVQDARDRSIPKRCNYNILGVMPSFSDHVKYTRLLENNHGDVFRHVLLGSSRRASFKPSAL